MKLAKAAGRSELTKRERVILDYLANGRSNSEIAAILLISERTVEGHVAAILKKLEAKCRSEVIVTALQRGLIRAQ